MCFEKIKAEIVREIIVAGANLGIAIYACSRNVRKTVVEKRKRK